LNQKNGGDYQIQRFSQKRFGSQPAPFRRPVWLPASSYYILAAVATGIFFLLVWSLFHDGTEDSPWAIAFVGAGLMLGGAIVLREVYLRKAINSYLSAERKLDYNIQNLQKSRSTQEESKISLEKNAAIIKSIEKKSEAARVLNKIASGHLEVFEVCGEYLKMAEKQLETVGAGSPRLAGLRRGREIIGELHRYHLLTRAEIESRALTQKAKNYATISKKINTAQQALSVLDTALHFYPNESKLTESEAALKAFIASIRVSHWIEQAERAAFKGNSKRAVSLYRDALFFLARENVKTAERETIAKKINAEIESLGALSAKKDINKGIGKQE